MFPVIEVQCPFCRTTGQIMAPPLGSIVVGPCPRCGEMVLLYDGTVLSLDKDIITGGSPEDKKQHLLETIVDMIAGKVDELVDSGDLGSGQKPKPQEKTMIASGKIVTPSVRHKDAPPISRAELRDFVDIDLRLINSKGYLEKVLGKNKKTQH